MPRPPTPEDGAHNERLSALNRRLRRAFLEGAEEQSRHAVGRALTPNELQRVLWHYPGDVIEHDSREPR